MTVLLQRLFRREEWQLPRKCVTTGSGDCSSTVRMVVFYWMNQTKMPRPYLIPVAASKLSFLDANEERVHLFSKVFSQICQGCKFLGFLLFSGTNNVGID